MPIASAGQVLRTVRLIQIGLVLSLAAALMLGAHADEEEDDTAFTTANQQDWLRGVPADPSPEWVVALGGRVYDNWAEVQFKNLPNETHPTYPPTGKQSGGTTWRCQECHGWDYNGVAGVNAKGEHTTGFPGVRRVRGTITEDRLRQLLRGDLHRFDEDKIPDRLIGPLAAFLDHGQVDPEKLVNLAGAGEAKGGNSARGQAIFQNVCAVCHGFDGKAINFGGEGNPEYLGTVARTVPAEFVHKMYNGQPGQPMPVMRSFGEQAIRDIIAYAQTLPVR